MEYIDEADQIDLAGLKEIDDTLDGNSNAYRIGLAAATAGGVKLAMRGEKTQHFQKKALDNMSNYLENYYGKAFGKEMPAKMGAFAKEAVKSTGGAVTGYFNPWSNYAYEATGLTQKTWNEFQDYQAEINQIYDDFNKVKNPTKGTIKNYNLKLKSVHKKINAKLINDSVNYSMFSDVKGTGTIVENYGGRTNQIKVLNYSKARKHLGHNSDQIARILTKNQGIDIKNTLYALKTKNIATGDVLFGLQFDPRAARLFADMNKQDNLPKMKKIKAFLDKNKWNYETRGKKIFFHLSPKMKPDLDWGGYQGIVEWDSTKPGKVRLHANDMRDWAGIKVGDRRVLNIVKPKTIGIPQIIKEIKDIPAKKAAKAEQPRKKYEHVKKPKQLTDPRNKDIKNIQREMYSQYKGARTGSKLPKQFMKKFLVSRLGAVGAVVAMAALIHDIRSKE
tara:strand:+ start:4438 stop:5778 length:1341 start_codon:yes stop_codon:yes gene_type:complete